MTTPKMAAMTPNSLGTTLGFSPALLGHSPAGASQLLKHRSPAASGGAALPPNFNSPGMLSMLGIGNHAGASGPANLGLPQLPPEQKRKSEMAEILRLLATRPGRISMASVERLARGIGMECYKEKAANGAVTLALGGRNFLIDVDFVGESRVVRVALSFENTPGPSSDLAPMAAAIFKKNLTVSPTGKFSLLTPSLSPFADNLARLFNTDKLSTPSMNCFAAITGVYEGLLKIYEHEKRNMDSGEVGAMCSGSGKPQMHTRGKVGLSVDYWKSRRQIPEAPPEGGEGEGDEEGARRRTWRVLIEVDKISPEFGQLGAVIPVRTTDHWVSDEVKKPRDNNLFGDVDESDTDWLDPPLEVLMDHPEDLSTSRPPSAHFVARLDPPVFLPYAEEHHLYAPLMINPPATPDLNTLENFLFPTLASSNSTAERQISLPPSGDDEEDTEPRHSYVLNAALKPVVGRFLSEIPFSHPKELVGYFAVLRQYALLQELLESCFAAGGEETVTAPPVEEEEEEAETETEMDMEMETELDSLDAFLSSGALAGSLLADVGLRVDVALVPVDLSLPDAPFGIDMVFPREDGLVRLGIKVGRNGEVTAKCVDDAPKGKGKGIEEEAVRRALAASEDLGLVVEWIRRSNR